MAQPIRLFRELVDSGSRLMVPGSAPAGEGARVTISQFRWRHLRGLWVQFSWRPHMGTRGERGGGNQRIGPAVLCALKRRDFLSFTATFRIKEKKRKMPSQQGGRTLLMYGTAGNPEILFRGLSK